MRRAPLCVSIVSWASTMSSEDCFFRELSSFSCSYLLASTFLWCHSWLHNHRHWKVSDTKTTKHYDYEWLFEQKLEWYLACIANANPKPLQQLAVYIWIVTAFTRLHAFWWGLASLAVWWQRGGLKKFFSWLFCRCVNRGCTRYPLQRNARFTEERSYIHFESIAKKVRKCKSSKTRKEDFAKVSKIFNSSQLGMPINYSCEACGQARSWFRLL